MIGRPDILPEIHRYIPPVFGKSCTTHARFVSMTASRASSRSDQSDHESADLPVRKYLEISIRRVVPVDAITRPPGRDPDQPAEPSFPRRWKKVFPDPASVLARERVILLQVGPP